MSREWTREEIDAEMDGYGQEGPPCPRCDGHRAVDCHCGGDLCVCENYGEKDCPLCYGEGVATPERAEKYLRGRREMAEVLRKAWAEDEAKAKR